MSFVFPIFSGMLLGIGFVKPSLSFLCWFALLPLIYFLNLKKISLGKSFLAGWLAGFIYFGQVLIWFFETWPLDWIGIEEKFIGEMIVFLIWCFAISFLALFVGFFSLSYQLLKKENWSDLLLIPALWIVFSYLGAWGSSLLFAGSQSLFGPHWSWGNLAYLLNENSFFRESASFGGIYLVSFLIVFFNAFLYFLFRQSRSQKIFGVFILTSLFLITLSCQKENKEFKFSSEPIKVAILQTKTPSFFYLTKEELEKRFEIQKNLLREVSQNFSEVQIIVLPEGSRFLVQKNFREILTDFFSGKKEILILDSKPVNTPEGIKPVAFLYNSRGEIFDNRAKILLAPLGEYLIYIIKIPAQILNWQWVEKFEKSRGYIRGKEIKIFSFPYLDDLSSAAPLFCSEVYSPDLHRQMVKKGAKLFFSLGSLAFAHGSRVLDSQTRAILQFRAAENGRYLVRASNFGTSYIIDSGGEIIQETTNFGNRVLFGQVWPISQKTFYTKAGDWILIFALLILILFGLKGRLFDRKFK